MSSKSDLLLITNRLLFSINGNQLPRQIAYVCADRRFGLSAEWATAAHNSPLDTFLTRDLIVRSGRTGDGVYEVPDVFLGGLAGEVFELFSQPRFPFMNVVLDYAIPVALFCGAKSVTLYGCEFDYGTEKETPLYWSGFRRYGSSFDHSAQTMFEWGRSSNYRFRLIGEFLALRGIHIGRHTNPTVGFSS